MIQLRFASLAAAAIVGAAQGAHASNAAPVIVFGTKLDCSSALERSPLAVATKSFGPKANAESLAWIDVQLNRVGVGAKPPIHPASQQIANLLRNGHVVAAKMVNDEASLGSEGYRATRWSSSIETLVTIMTQPVSHASYPTSVRAAGEVRNEAATSHATHGSDLEAASDSLAELLGRAALAKKALGTLYAKPSMRFYMLANGFRDPIAYAAASSQVCAMKLTAEETNKVDVTARLMAMPFKREFKEGAR